MNRIDDCFKRLKKEGKKAFIAYITAGDRNMAMTKKLVLALEASGADMVELGVPFSDPLADGPTIQAASQRALKNKVGLTQVFRMVRSLRRRTEMPIAFMTYYNPVFRYGIRKFVEGCAANGVDGVIIPDLPCEEAADLIVFARRAGVSTIFLVSPTSTNSRIKKIVKNTTGFVYYVSLTGVTGARKTLPAETAYRVKAVKAFTDKPVCVGFGVSTAAQARQVAKAADGVIVGSAIVKIIENGKDVFNNVSSLASGFSKAIHET